MKSSVIDQEKYHVLWLFHHKITPPFFFAIGIDQRTVKNNKTVFLLFTGMSTSEKTIQIFWKGVGNHEK